MNKKEWLYKNRKKLSVIGAGALLLFGCIYFLLIHNRVSTTSFRVAQSDMEEEQFYTYVEENASELSFSLQAPEMLTDEVKEGLLDGRDALTDGIYTWVDDEYDETHVVLVGDKGKVSGIYGVHKEDDNVLIGWSSEDWQTDGSSTSHIVHLVLDEVIDESDNQFHLVDVDMADEVSENVVIPTGESASLSDDELAEIDEEMDEQTAYSELMTEYFSAAFELTFGEWQALPDDEKEALVHDAGFDSVSDLEGYLAETVAADYNISIDAELEQLYQRYFGRSMQDMAELTGEEYREVIDTSAISQEEFQDMVNAIIDQKEGRDK